MEMSRRANEQRPVSSAGYGHDFCISCFDQVACSFHLQVDAGKRPPHQGLKLTKAWLNKIDPLVQRGAEGRTRRVEHHPRLLLPGYVDDGMIGVSRKAARHAPTYDNVIEIKVRQSGEARIPFLICDLGPFRNETKFLPALPLEYGVGGAGISTNRDALRVDRCGSQELAEKLPGRPPTQIQGMDIAAQRVDRSSNAYATTTSMMPLFGRPDLPQRTNDVGKG